MHQMLDLAMKRLHYESFTKNAEEIRSYHWRAVIHSSTKRIGWTQLVKMDQLSEYKLYTKEACDGIKAF